MKFTKLSLEGAYIIEIEPFNDERGFFARSWCQKEFKEHGLDARLVQCNISFNKHRGTLRGMHYQSKPQEEAKLIRCTRGSIYDVIIDLRQDSKTYKKWVSIELDSINRKMIYVPEGFAHGFVTLEDNTEVFYQVSEFYNPKYYKGIRWNDQSFNIQWPINENLIISKQDKSWEDFKC